MSGYYPYRFTTLHRAVSTALLCLVGSAVVLPTTIANAATVGKTVISSNQYEPLLASIEVSDIKAANFDVSLAHSAVYQQMGLTPTNSMSVRFVTTSATTGRLIVSTLQPVSTPFADVVLTINDGDRRTVVPKTLLMPLSNSVPISRATTQTIASAARPNLPVMTTQPLAVRRGAPPPLFTTPTIQTLTQPVVVVNAVNTARTTPQLVNPVSPVTSSISTTIKASAPNITVPIVVQAPMLPVQNNRLARTRSINNSNLSDNAFAAALTQLRPVVNNNRDNAISSLQPASPIVPVSSVLNANTGTTNAAIKRTPTDETGLNITNTLSINKTLATTQNDNGNDNSGVLALPPTPAPVSVNVQQDLLNQNILNIEVNRQISISASPSINNTIKATDKIDSGIDNQSSDSEQAIASNNLTDKSESSIPARDQISNNITEQDIASASVSYIVQRNDNLWVISKQLAEKNNLDVQTVMSQIQAQNPDAFINQDASRLKANAQLNLPNYDTIPSQQSLQSAIQDQKSSKISLDSLTDSTDTKTIPIESAATTATKKSPQARFSVIAPNLKGAANGTQTQGRSDTDDAVSSKVLTTLQSSRTRTADQVTKVRSINNTLGSYTKKLQLQNQKLAELEARLKKLRNQ